MHSGKNSVLSSTPPLVMNSLIFVPQRSAPDDPPYSPKLASAIRLVATTRLCRRAVAADLMQGTDHFANRFETRTADPPGNLNTFVKMKD